MKRSLVLVALAGICLWACDTATEPTSLTDPDITTSDEVLFKKDTPDKYCTALTFDTPCAPGTCPQPFVESGVVVPSVSQVAGGRVLMGVGNIERFDGDLFTAVRICADAVFGGDGWQFASAGGSNFTHYEGAYACYSFSAYGNPQHWVDIAFVLSQPQDSEYLVWADNIELCSDKPFTESKQDEKQKKDKKPK